VAETLLALRDVTVQYGASTILEIPSLEIQRGEVLAIIGPNGAGKSTLLRVMGLLQQPTTGEVRVDGQRTTRKNGLQLRRRMASVFQEPLLLNASVYDNAALGLKIRGLGGKEIERRTYPWLERLGIAPLASRRAATLSGGESQRASLARAFVLQPALLLLDEPFSALDPPTREALLFDLEEILKETQVTTVLVTHDRLEAFTIGQRVGVLSNGRLAQLGSKLDVLMQPADEQVGVIVGAGAWIPGVVEGVNGGVATVRFNGYGPSGQGNFEPGQQVILSRHPRTR
jgi:tungstate transport system ATP-binding protein